MKNKVGCSFQPQNNYFKCSIAIGFRLVLLLLGHQPNDVNASTGTNKTKKKVEQSTSRLPIVSGPSFVRWKLRSWRHYPTASRALLVVAIKETCAWCYGVSHSNGFLSVLPMGIFIKTSWAGHIYTWHWIADNIDREFLTAGNEKQQENRPNLKKENIFWKENKRFFIKIYYKFSVWMKRETRWVTGYWNASADQWSNASGGVLKCLFFLVKRIFVSTSQLSCVCITSLISLLVKIELTR